jgi:predicted CoA-binding protein
MSSMAVIQDFLAQRRIAVVGVSRDPKDFSRGMLRDLRQRGYDAVAVNPELQSVDDGPCFARLDDILPELTGCS